MKKYDLIVKEVNGLFSQYKTRMTLRQIFYRLVAKLIIPNNINQYKALSRYLVKARERKDVDPRMIEDRTRTTIGGRDLGWENKEDFMEAIKEYIGTLWQQFSLSIWEPQSNYVEVWVEKDALSALLSNACGELALTELMTCIGHYSSPRIRTCPSKGYSSYSYIMEAVERFRDTEKNNVVLYLGDYDPSGLDITRDLQDRLSKYGASVKVKRIALNREQIDEYQLPPMMAKSSDPRLAKFIADTGGTDAVELDALEPPVLREVVLKGLRDNLDMDTWMKRIVDIKAIKEELQPQFENMSIDWGEAS